MGLDTTHGAYSGSYSGFNNWRRILAATVNINLDSMMGFGGDNKWDETANYHPLLNHSDCDGDLTPDECKKTVEFLEVAILKLTDEEMIYKTSQFITGCKRAIKKSESILFQ